MKIKIALLCLAIPALMQANEQKFTPDQALKRLMEGNARFAQDKPTCPVNIGNRRSELATAQYPFAVIVGCSDSRLALSTIFDQSLGDIFAVRVAGNVVGPLEQDSINYGAKHLLAPLIMVLGHESCGAIKAVVNKGTDIPALTELIKPAVLQAKKLPGNIVENAIKMNVKLVVEQIKKTPTIAELIAAKKIRIVGGYYNLVRGIVELL